MHDPKGSHYKIFGVKTMKTERGKSSLSLILSLRQNQTAMLPDGGVTPFEVKERSQTRLALKGRQGRKSPSCRRS